MEETEPSFKDILESEQPPEWIPFIVLGSVMTLAILALDVWAFVKHKKYSTKFPLQFFCTFGILQVYPFFSLMALIGMIVPRAHELAEFSAESLECLTFLFFLRLCLTYLGGKKATKSILEGSDMHINVPPLCCLVCLPSVKFSRKFFIFCEFLIYLYTVFRLALGFLELVMLTDAAEEFPHLEKGTHVITGKFSAVCHTLLLVLLFFAVYGLSGIYHTAEELLKNRGIVKKFLVYKIFTLVVKFQSVIFISLIHHDVIGNKKFGFNEIWSADLRVRNCLALAICVEAIFAFPLALKFYNTDDYVPGNVMQEVIELEDTRHDIVANVVADQQPETMDTIKA